MKLMDENYVRYYEDEDWIIELVMKKDEWEVYLQKKECFIKKYIYGEPRDSVWNTEYDYFLELALMNIDDDKEAYMKEVDMLEENGATIYFKETKGE